MLESQLIHQILPTLPSASTMKSSVPDSKMMFQSCKRNVNTPPQSTGWASALRPKKLGWGSISSSLLEVPKHTWLMMIRESWMAIVPGFYLRISLLHSSRWTSSLSWQLKRQFKTSWPTHLSPSHPVLVTILVILLILYVCVYIYIYIYMYVHVMTWLFHCLPNLKPEAPCTSSQHLLVCPSCLA